MFYQQNLTAFSGCTREISFQKNDVFTVAGPSAIK